MPRPLSLRSRGGRRDRRKRAAALFLAMRQLKIIRFDSRALREDILTATDYYSKVNIRTSVAQELGGFSNMLSWHWGENSIHHRILPYYRLPFPEGGRT